MSVSCVASSRLTAFVVALALLLPTARASINLFPPGQEWHPGTDGAFNPTANVEIDLSQAVTGAWGMDNTANAGKGVYDGQKWAVVFKYSSVNIPAGVTVTFKNHHSRAPVVWLVDGNVTINGLVNLNGKDGGWGSTALIEPGPGGFRGGSGITNCAGLGPGGASLLNYGRGNYASEQTGTLGKKYGNLAIVPLIGGSGGSYVSTQGGGGGGGAIAIACTGLLTLNGRIEALGGRDPNSGDRYGSGGAVRLVSEAITGGSSGNILATAGGVGRIRIDCVGNTYAGGSNPQPTFSVASDPPVIWPTADLPGIEIRKIGARDVPADPHAGEDFPNHDVGVQTVEPLEVRLEAKNVPIDGSWKAYLRVVPRSGNDFTLDAVYVSGDINASIWQATLNAPTGITFLQARAYKQ